MAGGMGGGSGLPLSERLRADQAPAEPAAAPAGPPTHCWVGGGCAASWLGVLLEWRSGADGWEGRVAYGVASAGSVRLVEQWITAAHLTRLD